MVRSKDAAWLKPWQPAEDQERQQAEAASAATALEELKAGSAVSRGWRCEMRNLLGRDSSRHRYRPVTSQQAVCMLHMWADIP
eukprot:Skav203064  [mRNA]  locus=scaffold4669:135443:136343:- [translate_table: standard]